MLELTLNDNNGTGMAPVWADSYSSKKDVGLRCTLEESVSFWLVQQKSKWRLNANIVEEYNLKRSVKLLMKTLIS